MKNIAFIGVGNMASSLIGGLIADGYDPQKIWASSPDEEQRLAISERFAIHTSADNNEIVVQAQVLIFAVKPHILSEVVKQVAQIVQSHQPLVVSVAAGVREVDIQHWLGGNIPIVRCMPNTPALVGSGATGLYANNFTSAEQKDLAESIMRAVGITLWMAKEQQLDTVTALSGSGPAYFFLVMEALEKAAQANGLSAQEASLLTKQTALGAAHMALQTELDTATLRQHVTSPGGTTERAIEVLQSANISDIFGQALNAAKQRAVELADMFSDTQEPS